MRAIKIKTKNFVTLFFSLILTLAVFSQISAIKPQTTSDVVWGGGLNKADWLYYKSSNDLSAYLGKKSSSLPTVRYQKGGDYLEFSMTGSSYSKPVLDSYNLQPNTYNLVPVSSTTSVSLETNVKQPNTPTLFYRNILDGADVNYQITSIPFRVKEEIVLQSIKSIKLKVESQNTNLPPTTFLFSAETTAKPVKQDDGSVAFFDNQNNYLFQLDKPFMIDGKGTISNDVSVEIKPTSDVGLRRTNKTKNTSEEMFFGDSNLEWKRGLPPDTNQYIGAKNFVNTLNKYIADIKNVLDLGGIEPPKSLVATRDSLQARPRTGLFYHKENFNQNRHRMSVLGTQRYTITLTASSDWLNDPNTTYPVIIDPTVTHNADANFTGQFNRIADSDTTSSTQLESSYPEATKDPYTVLLLHFNEANGTTAGIRDYASTTRVITANGNASTTNSVTQLGLGNSAAFDGTGDYLTVPDSSDFDFGTGDFTVDFWIYSSGATVYDGIISGLTTSAGGGSETGWQIVFLNSQKIRLTKNNGTSYLLTSSADITTNKWHHVALVRKGNSANDLAFYIDGVLDVSGDGNVSLNAETSGVVVGRLTTDANGDYFPGSLDSLRIIKGRALTSEEIKAAASRRPYAVYTSPVLDATASVQWDTVNWTEGGVNTGDGETPYSTNSLVAQWNFNETSGTTATSSTSGSCQTCAGTLNGFSYTASQDQATTTTGWTANNKRWGAGGLMFDGTNDYVSVGDNAGFDFGTGDLTIETWINPSTLSTGAGSEKGIISTYNSTADNGWRLLYYNSELLFQHLTAGSADFVQRMSFTPADSIGKWNHIAVVVSSGSATIYKNGFVTTSVSTAGTSINGDTGNNGLVIGNAQNNPAANQYFQGIIDSTRIYKGRALSASEILSNYNAGNIEIQTRTGATSDPNDGSWEAWKPTTGETQLLNMDSDQVNWKTTSDKFTKLLIHADEASGSTSLTDSSPQSHTITANGNASTTNAQSKFGGLSAAFDGTTDYLTIPDSDDWNFGGGNFTIDLWARLSANTESDFYVQTAGGAGRIAFYYEQATGQIFFVGNNGSNMAYYRFAWTPTLNQWYHLALVRNGTNIYIFVDGVSQTLTVDDAINSESLPDLSASLTIGSHVTYGSVNGYLDEVRISKGIARWTSNFTPPAFAHPNQEGAITRNNETTLKQEGAGSAKLTLGAPQIDGNTVALWHFEETGTTTGTYLYDETANNNDATTTGTTVVDGIFGKARKFNGTSDYASALDSENWNFGSGDFSIDFWFRDNNSSAQYPGLIDNGMSLWTTGAWNIVYDNKDGGYNNKIVISKYGDTGTPYVSTNTFARNIWHHLVLTKSGSTLSLYVNGNLEKSASVITTYDLSLGGQVLIGRGAQWEGANGYFKGDIDEFRILKGRALSADEIAETYRMGANHHLTRQVSATDLSGANKLAFNVAADRPGTYLEAMLGESDYANYELASSTLALSTNTVLYIKGDEIASSTSLKDSSFSGKAITANGNARTSGNGKIGNSVYFDGTTTTYLTAPDSEDWNFGSGNFSIDFWVYHNTAIGSNERYVSIDGGSSLSFSFWRRTTGVLDFYSSTDGLSWTTTINTTETVGSNSWHHIAVVRNGATTYIFIDGVAATLTGNITGTLFNSVGVLNIASYGSVDPASPLKGYLDELRIVKGTALTPDQIRQAYEYGLRTHPITIDFGATLQTSDLISSATDYNFSLTATTSGLSATTSGLYLGDKIIIKENLGGTEYTAQGTVNAINTTTGAITVPSWDTGSTFPSGNGYSPNATVFKWQREYFDLGGAATTTRNAITNLTLRPTNGAEGRTIYLDDFRYNTNYLTASSSSAITSSNNRYLQYRAIFSSWDSFVSPYLSAINTLYTSTANMFAPIIGISGGGFLSF